MVTKTEGGRKVIVIQVLYGIVAIEGYFKFDCAVSLLNSIFPFPVAMYSFLNRHCHDK